MIKSTTSEPQAGHYLKNKGFRLLMIDSLRAALADDQPDVNHLSTHLESLKMDLRPNLRTNGPFAGSFFSSKTGTICLDRLRALPPLIFILGPSEEDINQLCTQFVTRYKTKTLFVSMSSLVRSSGRLQVEGFTSYDQLLSCGAIEELFNLLFELSIKCEGTPTDGILISGFPRSLKDLSDLNADFSDLDMALKALVKGVCLIDYEEVVLKNTFSNNVAKIAKYQQTVLKVAQHYDVQGLLSVIEGPSERNQRSGDSLTGGQGFHGLLTCNCYELPLKELSLVIFAIWAKAKGEREQSPANESGVSSSEVNGVTNHGVNCNSRITNVDTTQEKKRESGDLRDSYVGYDNLNQFEGITTIDLDELRREIESNASDYE